jgi:hypothetical protein
MTKAALKNQVGRNFLSYVDDIVVLSKKKENYLSDLAETFANMREAKLKLNPEKMCVWDYMGEDPRMSSFNEGHRSKPRQNQGNYPDATSAKQKGYTKAHGPHSIIVSIHLKACRM